MKEAKSLGEHLSEMMKIVGYVQKDAYNKFHKYSYASADAVLTRIREELSVRGIYIERDTSRSGVSYATEDLTNVIYDWVGFLVKGEEKVPICGTGQGKDSNDKAVMKAETAALKYALSGQFLISWGDDPEKEDGGHETSRKAPAKPKKPRGAEKADPVDIKPIVERIQKAARIEELEQLVATAKRLTIRDQDKTVLNEAYKTKKQELAN